MIRKVYFRWRIYTAIATLFFLIVFTFITKIWVVSVFWQVKSSSWTGVNAEVIYFNPGKSKEYDRDNGTWDIRYNPSIKYKYSWEGKSYTSDRFSFVDGHNFSIDSPVSKHAQHIDKIYKSEGGIHVFVDAANPSQSVIVRKTEIIDYVALIISSILLGFFSCFSAYYTFKKEWDFRKSRRRW